MIRLSIAYLKLWELFVSSLVHLLYGFYIFSSAVAGDLSEALNEIFQKPKKIINVEVKEKRIVPSGGGARGTNADDLPPIVLVHGIFGFGKGVRAPSVFLYLVFLQSYNFNEYHSISFLGF